MKCPQTGSDLREGSEHEGREYECQKPHLTLVLPWSPGSPTVAPSPPQEIEVGGGLGSLTSHVFLPPVKRLTDRDGGPGRRRPSTPGSRGRSGKGRAGSEGHGLVTPVVSTPGTAPTRVLDYVTYARVHCCGSTVCVLLVRDSPPWVDDGSPTRRGTRSVGHHVSPVPARASNSRPVDEDRGWESPVDPCTAVLTQTSLYRPSTLPRLEDRQHLPFP